MQNNFSKCREWVPRGTSQHKWRWLTTLLLILTLGIGQMWGDTFTASEIAAKSGDVNVGTTKNHVTVSSLGITSTTNTQIWKDGSTAKNEAAVVLSAEPTSSGDTYNKSASFVEIRAERGYALGSTISVRGGSTKDGAKLAVIVYWDGEASPTFTSYDATNLSLGGKKQTSNPSDINLTVPSGARTARIYRKVKVTDASKLIAGNASSSKGGGYAAIVHVIASAVLAPEIEGESQMLNDETITLVGYPAGGTWGVKAGDPGTITADGKLTATGNGTIHVTYTVDEVEETKEIVAAATKTLVWNFDTKDVLPTTAGIQVTTTRNSGFNNDGSLKLTTKGSSGECDFAYIDLTSKNWEIVSVVANVKAGGTGDGKNISFGSAASDVMDGNIAATSTSAADYNITPIKSSTIFSIARSSGTGITLYKLTLTVKKYVAPETYTLAWEFAGGSCSATAGDDYTAGGQVAEGATITYPAANTMSKSGSIFDGWSSSATEMPASDLTITAQWATAYTVTFAANGGGGTMDPRQYKATAEVPIPDCGFSPEDGDHAFTHWTITGVPGKTTGNPGETFDMPAGPVTLTAQWAASYGITKGSHTNGDFTIDPTSAAAGTEITLAATPGEGYLFGAWEVVKTSDGTDAGVTVTNNKFEMPAFAVTVNATFVTDTRKKILYVTGTAEETVKANDKLYAALKDDYRVTIVGPTSDADQTSYDLVVLHESVGGGNYGAAAVAAAKAGNTPVLNTKTYFYGNTNDASQRWQWGAPNAGQTVNGATLNSAYCNVASHPLFSGVTMTAGFFAITDVAAAKCMQPIGSFTSGKEGYILATTPNAGEGNGCAIHELTPAQRGASAGKYLMISVSSAKLDALNANGQKLFQNAAAYLIGSTAWEPIAVPTSPEVTATPTAAYSVGDNIALTASATGTSAATTYTWYKGDDLATAKSAGAIKDAATAAAGGNTYEKATSVVGDAGTYWCVISNGTDCEASASLEITVSDASYNITFVSAHGSAPAATTGVSYTLPELSESGWEHQGWTASIDVTVDADPVTAGTTIANGKVASFGADVEFTAVWAQEFQVSFNLQGYGTPIAPQDIVDGGKVTKPSPDPSESGYEFGGWYKESACTNAWDFDNDVVTEATELFAKWTADPCPTPFSLSKVVLTSASEGTVTGYNNDEYAGEAVIGGLKDDDNTAEVDPSHEGVEEGYKLNGGGSGIVFATLKKGNFQEGDRVIVTITAKQNSYKIEEVSQDVLHIYYGTNASDATKLTTLESVSTAGSYTYRLKAADITAIGTKKGIGVFRESSNGQNPYVYSVEIKGCRSFAVMHTLTFKNIDGTATIAAEPLEEGAYASTVAPKAPRVSAHSFLGWSTTKNDADAIVNLAEYTITEDKTLYAVYAENDCSGNGLMFSQVAKANTLTDDYSLSGTTEESIGEYATVTGGEVYLNNNSSNTRVKIAKTTSVIQLTNGDEGYIHVLLDCPLKAKDSIKVDNTNKWVIAHNASKTDKASLASSVHFFIVPAEWEGKDEFYIWRDGSSCNISTIQVIRPVLYTVSFDMMEHGNAIAAMTGVPENSKIVAPATPTDEDYSFGGWYKENTLENEWNFASDVVDEDITLFAKWIDKSDATLKTLRYGDTEIALEAGEFTYNVNLSPLATTVPALTAVTSSPNATAQVNNAAALDGEGHATSTVVVTPEVGAAKTYTVNFTKVHLYTELVDVTGHTEWSWVGMSTQEIDKANEIGTILANYVIGNHFEKIEGKADEYASRNTDGGVYQGTYLKFHTTVPGAVTVTYRGTGNSSNVTLTIGTEQLETYAGGFTDSKKVIVPAGDVKITSEGTMRVQKIVFQTLDEVTPDYSRPVTIDRMGTVCVDHNVPAGCFIGAEVYRLLYWKYGTSYADCLMVDFEEVDEMEAGNPYLIIPTEETFKLYYGGVKDETPNEVNHFIGTYNPIAQGTEGDAILMGKYGVVNNQIRLLGSGAYSPANRAYIDLENLQSKEEYEAANPSNPAPKKRISLSREGAAVATGLDAINVDTETVQKVMIDGQMYIIRGGHIFTVSGNLVK